MFTDRFTYIRTHREIAPPIPIQGDVMTMVSRVDQVCHTWCISETRFNLPKCLRRCGLKLNTPGNLCLRNPLDIVTIYTNKICYRSSAGHTASHISTLIISSVSRPPYNKKNRGNKPISPSFSPTPQAHLRGELFQCRIAMKSCSTGSARENMTMRRDQTITSLC